MKPTRRGFLATSGAGLVAGCAPRVQDSSPLADEEAPATIEHVLVIMMENRSFDHFFGALKLEEGRADVNGLDATMSNPDADGTEIAVFPADVDCVPDPHHGWDASREQWNEGENDGFVLNYGGGEVMSYQRRENLPVSYALADSFCLCDQYFCSVMGPTWPNRFYGHAATSDGQTNNDFPTDGAFTFTTVWNKLDEAGVEWCYYYTDLPFIGLFSDHFRTGFHGLIEDLFWDLDNGRLPPVSWIDPGFSYCDDHPPHFVGLGQEWLAAIVDALGQSEFWDKCLLLITYDEHGGFFDHVSPPTTEDDFADEGFDQMGFRVPVVVVGPYVKQGVCSTVFDHASWIKMVCDLHGIEPWNKRIAAATSLAEVLDTDRMARREPLPPPNVPIPDYSDHELGAECDGQGVFGPPLPDPKQPLPASLEPWHNLMRYLHREDDATHRVPQTIRLIRERLQAIKTRR